MVKIVCFILCDFYHNKTNLKKGPTCIGQPHVKESSGLDVSSAKVGTLGLRISKRSVIFLVGPSASENGPLINLRNRAS